MAIVCRACSWWLGLSGFQSPFLQLRICQAIWFDVAWSLFAALRFAFPGMIDMLLDRKSGLQMWGEIDPAENDTAICLPILSGRALVKGVTNLAWVAVGLGLLLPAASAYRSGGGRTRGNCSRIAEQMADSTGTIPWFPEQTRRWDGGFGIETLVPRTVSSRRQESSSTFSYGGCHIATHSNRGHRLEGSCSVTHSCFLLSHFVRLAAQPEAPILRTVQKSDVDVWYGAIVLASEKYHVLVHWWL
jgi:hypothetical protein